MAPNPYQPPPIPSDRETHCGIPFPSSLLPLWTEFEHLATNSKFASAFPMAQQATVADIQAAWASELPSDLVPFMLEKQDGWSDYYCFRRVGDQCEEAVVVFADHAVVATWEDFKAFLSWLNDQCA